MRRWSVIMLVLLAACSKAAPDGSERGREGGEPATDNRVAAPTKEGVDVGPTLVSGLAVAYSYQYLLPVAQVQRTLEQHASACEALGPAKCRITGLQYHAGVNRSISAELDLKFAPPVARGFGRQATGTVVTNGGMLTDSEISSIEAGAAADKARANTLIVETERADLQRQLAQPGLPAAERQQLQARIVSLREAAQTGASTADDAAALLASTPMRIAYRSGTVDPGYADGPILGAVKDGWANVIVGAAVIVRGAITLLPWVLALLAGIALYRVGRRYFDRWTGTGS